LKIGELIRAYLRITVLELLQEVGISVGSVEKILHNELKVSRVSARWVPRLLSPEQRERRLMAITQLLQRYESEAEFLDSVGPVMRPGSTTSLLNQKEQTSSGKTPILHPPKKAKAISSAGKIMTAVFWDS
jgi:histone-lysine N-methyltransferase SETMAR